MVAKDRLDVVVAGDDPVAEHGAEEDRLLLARPAQVARRVLQVGVAERIEFGSLPAERAGCLWPLAGYLRAKWFRTSASANTVTIMEPPSRFR